MIKYIGSKRVLVPLISEIVERISLASNSRTVVDLFSGTARVGHALKSKGLYGGSPSTCRQSQKPSLRIVKVGARGKGGEL